MKKKILIFIVLLMLGFMLSIPKVYALEPMPNYYSRTNNALNIVSWDTTANGTWIRYATDNSYIYRTIMSTNNFYDPFIVVLTDLDMTSQFISLLSGDVSLYDAIDAIYMNVVASEIDLINFGEYSDDDDRTKQIYSLKQYGGQDYLYVYTKETVSYQNDSIFIISEVSYNQYMNYLLNSNQVYNDGYDMGKQDGILIGYANGKDEYGLRGGIYGNANYWFSQGQLSETDLWASLLSAFFGVFGVLSIEILPGIELGYFVGFFLLLGVSSMIIGTFMIRRK